MKTLISTVALLLSLSGSSPPRAQIAQAPPTPPPPPLLTTEMMSQRYCRGSAKLDVVQMRLRLRYANTGRQKLILYKGHNLFYQTKIRRRADSNAASKPYEVVVLHARYFDEQPENIETSGPNKYFAVLGPGAVYETEIVASVNVVGEGMERGNNAIKDGEHTLQLVVSSWYKSKDLAERLRQRWQRHGLLLVDPVASVPLKFTVERPQTVVSCQ